MVDSDFFVTVKHGQSEIVVDCLKMCDSVGDLKDFLFTVTDVEPKNQRLMGLVLQPGVTFSDDILLVDLKLPKTKKIMLVGTATTVINKVLEAELQGSDAIDDFDISLKEELSISERPEYLAKVSRRCNNCTITEINPPRDEKALLVLDIDYTIYDHISCAESVCDQMRPYLLEFLTSVYPYYDIGIWSATSRHWIEAKLSEMDLFNSLNAFKISFIVDATSMISVLFRGKGVKDVKPLQVIWTKYPNWSRKNTIMLDDLKRNFVMNPSNGLAIPPYRDCHVNRLKDTVLLDMKDYLLYLLSHSDFSAVNHCKWMKYVLKARSKQAIPQEQCNDQ